MIMKKLLVLGLAGMLGVLASANVSLANDDVAEQQKRLDDYRAMEGEIVFYGKVVDQYGQPVAGAAVKVEAPTAGELGKPEVRRKKTVFTGSDGRFEVSRQTYSAANLRGVYLAVEDITKDGYESQRNEWLKRNQILFSFSMTNAARFVPDAANPIVYALRKKGEVAALLEEPALEFAIPTAGSGKAVGYDFIQRHRIRDVAKPSGDDRSLVCDLQVKATFNANDATWEVVLLPGNTNGGVIVSGKLLYEAPETGYEAEYTFTPDDRKPIGMKYVYLKSRDPAIYTRLEVEHVHATKEIFQIDLTSATNPYGERNLEEATDLPGQVRIQLADDAQAAFRQNKRPVKPDLAPLIQTARAAEKARAEKEAAKLRRLQEGCSFDPARIRIRAAKGHLVASHETILPDNTTISEGDPRANVPIRIVIGVSQNMGFGESGPIWKPSKTWCYYTFTDAKGGFDIPAWAGECTEKPEAGTNLEVTGLQFDILAADDNAGVVAEGPDAVYPYRISHLTAPLAKSLATLLEMKAAPLHPEDKTRFQALCRELNVEAEKPPKGPP